MKTKTIVSPAGWVAQDLLTTIEQTPDAFVDGRRNNDVVNWFITKRLVDMDHWVQNEGLGRLTDRLREDFSTMLSKLSTRQQDDLAYWSEGWENKINTLVNHYGRVTDSRQLFNLWLPMDYEVPEVPEDQTALPMEV